MRSCHNSRLFAFIRMRPVMARGQLMIAVLVNFIAAGWRQPAAPLPRARSSPGLTAMMIVPAAVSVAALLLVPAGRAYAQTPSPVVIPGVFDPDLADVKAGKDAEIRQAVEKFGHDCYPPTVTTYGSGGEFAGPLAGARADSIRAALGGGLNVVANTNKSAAIGSLGNGVQVSYGPFSPGDDKDPPVLEVHSDPPKGTKVTAGQQIKVTIKASERYADGHKSWPSGIQVIQLTADDGLVNSQDYGKPPDPCSVRTVTWPYTVPANPPPVLHLLAETENGAGLQATKSADFPTADWYGTLKGRAQGNMYNDAAMVTFSFDVANDNVITGKGHAKVTSAPQDFAGCTITLKVTPDEFDVDIGGRLDGGEFKLAIKYLKPGQVHRTQVCPKNPRSSGSADFPINPFLGVGVISVATGPNIGVTGGGFYHPRVRAEDGATNTLSTKDVAGEELTASIEIHAAKRAAKD